jgi:hypothetical protein
MALLTESIADAIADSTNVGFNTSRESDDAPIPVDETFFTGADFSGDDGEALPDEDESESVFE